MMCWMVVALLWCLVQCSAFCINKIDAPWGAQGGVGVVKWGGGGRGVGGGGGEGAGTERVTARQYKMAGSIHRGH